MNARRFFKRSLFFLVLGLCLFCLSGALLVYTYQDMLVSKFLQEANQKIDTPINAQSIEASWWEKFPAVSIVLTDVIVDGSLPGTADTLATAENIYCTFNAWDILKGNWVVNQIHVENGHLFMVQTELGDNNFTIVNRDTSIIRKHTGFKLEKILLKNVAVTYLDLLRNQEYRLQAHRVIASLTSKEKAFDVQLQGDVTSQALLIDNNSFFKEKTVALNGTIRYHQVERKWDILETEISTDHSNFLINGFYQGVDDKMDLTFKSSDTDIQTLLSLLPKHVGNKFRRYKSKGELYFEGVLRADGNKPQIDVNFGCRNAYFFHPKYARGIEQVYLSGNYSSPQANDLTKATLTLKGVRGIMESQSFQGNLEIRNLENYYVKGDFEGILDLNSWHKFLPSGNVTEAQGIMQIDIAFDGPVQYLKSPSSVDKFKTSGEIFIEDLSFGLEKYSLPFKNFDGHFLFNGRDLAISDFKGTVGNSDFMINGFFRNIIAFIFSKNQPIGIEADLKASNLDFDELLTGNSMARNKTIVGKQSYTSFEINPRLALTFDCEVDRLKFRRFRGKNIKGKLMVSDQVAKGQQIQIETLGGQVTMSGRVDGHKNDHIKVYTKSSYQGIHLDSLFYVFENFGQNFLEDKHLKGQAFAEIETYMAFDDHLRFKSPDLVVSAGLTIENGELNNFEPLQKLSTYLDSEDLKHLTFADLKNNVHIKDREILLPDMVVKSNVNTIAVNGSHTFDQDINYRLKVPLKSGKKDKDEYFGALEEDGLDTNLFLKITGTTKDYRVIYDKTAVKAKIKNDLKEEKWEIREAVRNKGTKTSTQELDEDDFFDFEETDSTALHQ